MTFDPPLAMKGALTISSLSEEWQLKLPAWLDDEIFDLTFGGAPSPQIFIPRREICQPETFEPFSTTTASERPVSQVIQGELSLSSSSGIHRANVGQCVGASSVIEAEYTSIADSIEVLMSCPF